MSERIDDPTFNANDYAINKVYGQDEFSFGGHIYEKSGGSTFLQTDQVPGGSVEVHPNAAAEIDAKRLDDTTMDYKRQQRASGSDSDKTSSSSTLSPALLDHYDRETNAEWYEQQNLKTSKGASRGSGHETGFNPLDYKTHPDYSKSLERVKQDQRFSHDGNEYFRHNGATYKQQNTIPSVGKLLPPEAAEKIDDERARRQMDLPIQEADGPGEALASGITSGGFALLRGAPFITSLGKAAVSFAGKGATDLAKDTMRQ